MARSHIQEHRLLFDRVKSWLSLLLFLPLMLSSGCAGLSRETNRAIYDAKNLDLRNYRTVRIVPLALGNSGAPETAGQIWAQKLKGELAKKKHFSAIEIDAPTGSPTELVVAGTITEYVPGNAAVRSVAGAGTRAKVLVTLSSATRRDFHKFPADSYSMGGALAFGVVGAAVGAGSDIDFMMESSAMVAGLVINKAKH